MQFNTLKCVCAENKRLQSLVTKLTGTIETIHLQLKQKEVGLAKRRIEVATLHQACAKYKRARHHLSTTATSLTTARSIKQAVSTSDVQPTTIVADCLRCQKANEVFERELKVALEGLAEKLRTEFAEKEAQFTSALREKDDKIGKHVANLAAKERAEQERRLRNERQRAEERVRAKKHYQDTIRKMDEMKARNQRESDELHAEQQRLARERELEIERDTAQRLREINERYAQRVRLNEQQFLVDRRRRTGVADAA